MSATALNSFLKALDAVKQDYICSLCNNFCSDPVTLSKCFHIICSKHFDNLNNCPTCDVSLEGATTFRDDRLALCVESTKELANIFQQFRTDEIRNEKTNRNKRSKTSSERLTLSKTDLNLNASTSSNQKNKRPVNKKSENLNSSIVSNKSNLNFNKTLEKRNNKGETALHVACRVGQLNKVIDMLNQGANTNTKDNAGWTPLHEAVQNARLDIVKVLLQFNTLIDVPGQGNETPLHEAVRYNHKEIATMLVMNGADMSARNCKGETPLQLATGDMKDILVKASENIILTQSLNVTNISLLQAEIDFDDIKIYCISSQRTVHSKLKLLAKHHANLHIEAKLSKKVTHLIADAEDNGVCVSSLDVLQGIVNGSWIVTTQWVMISSDTKLESFVDYEVKGVGTKSNCGPKISRYNKYKQLPGIFNGCHFYLHNFNTKYEITKNIIVNKISLTKLITDAGGIVLRRVPNPELIPDSEKLVPYHAKKDGKLVNCSHYIIFKDIYEPMYNMQHIKALPIGWLIECIEKYELCDPW